MTLGEKQRIFSRLLATFILHLYEIEDPKVEISIGEVYRTKEQQELYVENGLSKTLNSQHRLKLAADLNVFVNGLYVTGKSEEDQTHLRILGETWEELCRSEEIEPEWGGRFGVKKEEYKTKIGWDANHFGIK